MSNLKQEEMMISKNEAEAFNHDCIIEFYKFISEHRFYVSWGSGSQEIRIRIEQDAQGRYHFSQSHYIQTPEQAGAYVTSRNMEDDADSALDRAVETITSYYESAVQDGHSPSESWFIKNDLY